MSSLTPGEKKTLLKLARDTVTEYVTNNALPPLPFAEGTLAEMRGAFVTLHHKGNLRGCIGMMIGIKPLMNTIQEMAVAAATRDTRFKPVKQKELTDIEIEISVLSPLKQIQDVGEIEVGKHGIIISKDLNHGVLLPQVATEEGWDKETFLAHTCFKAGLKPSAWQDKEAVIQIFEAEVFSEKEFKDS